MKSQITLAELRKEKADLEEEIYSVIRRFEEKCDCGIKALELKQMRRVGDSFAQLAGIGIELDLGL